MGWHRRPVRHDRLTRKRSIRRWWRPATAVATAVALLIAGMPPANAAWSEEWWLPRLDVNKAWTVSKGAGVTVGVVDTGVVDKLGDLSGRVLPGANFVGSGDGRSDPDEEEHGRVDVLPEELELAVVELAREQSAHDGEGTQRDQEQTQDHHAGTVAPADR